MMDESLDARKENYELKLDPFEVATSPVDGIRKKWKR